MRIVFHSIDSNDNKVFFKCNGSMNDNILIFEDKSIPDTMINIELYDGKLVFKRLGRIDMLMPLELGKRTKGFYKNTDVFDMELDVLANKINVKKNKIEIEYTLFMDDEPFSTHKIGILIENT